MKTLLNNGQLDITLQRLAHQLVENHLSFNDTVIIGIQPRGIFLSDRIVKMVKKITGNTRLDYGKLDITFYRDDVQARNIHVPADTNIPFSVEGKNVVLIEDNAHVTPDGRHLNEQITDKAISYISRQQKVAPGKPFFLYYSPGATHAPHQVDKFWSDQYKGKFDEGWDVFRERVIANQKRLGIVPAYAQLPERNPRIQAWNSLTADQKKLFERFIEVYAGYLTYTDFQIGRLINYLKENNLLDNTIVFVIIGDNGASK